VREVAREFSEGDTDGAARTLRILRRASWATGIIGWVLAAILSRPISVWLFGSTNQTTSIAVLGVTLLVGTLGAGEMAVLQGSRRINDIAWSNVLGTLISTFVAILMYVWLGIDGILPVLIISAFLNAAVSYCFSRRIAVPNVALSWAETIRRTKRFLGLGFAFMWSGVLIAGLDVFTRSVVTNEFGVHGAGIYQAAWGLSGIFAGFILGAMGADYYPRLTGVIHDRELTARMVNEQTEIGILLALPGLLGTLVFAPLIMTFFYSTQFIAGAALLSWMVVGVFGRVLSWPMGFILLAKGSSRWFVAVETIFAAVQVGLLLWMVDTHGLVGVGLAFAGAYASHTITMLGLARHLTGFAWSRGVKWLVFISFVCIAAGLSIQFFLMDSILILVAGSLVTLAGTTISLWGLAERLGPGKSLTQWIFMVPGARAVIKK
jgi:PST family polysaccharide transporter